MQLSVLVREIDLSACGELSAVIDNAGRIPEEVLETASSRDFLKSGQVRIDRVV